MRVFPQLILSEPVIRVVVQPPPKAWLDVGRWWLSKIVPLINESTWQLSDSHRDSRPRTREREGIEQDGEHAQHALHEAQPRYWYTMRGQRHALLGTVA